MKRTFGSMALVLILGFLLVFLWKQSSSDVPGDNAAAEDDVARARLRSFWDRYHEGTRLRVRQEFEAAAAAYREALELNPKHEESLYYLANCLIETGDYRPAAALYRRLIELNPRSQRGGQQLASLLASRLPGAPNDFETARRLLRRSVEVNPEESGPFLRLGLLELALGRLEEAAKDFQTASGFRSPEGLFLTGYVRFRQGRLQEARELFSQVIEIERRERAISRRGVTSEGDLDSDAPAPDNPLHSATLRSQAYLNWIQSDWSKTSETELAMAADRGASEWRNGRAAWADFDSDGDPDLLVAARRGPILFENRNGRLRALKPAGLPPEKPLRDSRWGDYDGDGDPDLLLLEGTPGKGTNLSLYRNEGGWGNRQGRFAEISAEAGLEAPLEIWSASFFDSDNDGRLELLLVGAGSESQPGVLLFEMGEGRFTEISRKTGLQTSGSAVDAAVDDYDGDGFADVFLLRWKRPAILFRNDGRGGFSDATREAGLSDVGGDGFSCLFFDYDRDGDVDLLVTIQAPEAWTAWSRLHPERPCPDFRPQLFRNDGGRFSEVGAELGLDRCYGTLAAAAGDVDADGWPDLILANGGLNGERMEPGVVLRNLNGSGFAEKWLFPLSPAPAGVFGVAAADLDGDGGSEIFLSGSGLHRLEP